MADAVADNLELYDEATAPQRKWEILADEVKSRILAELGGRYPEVPEGLMHIVTEVTRMKFNLLGNEGLSTLQTEGMTVSTREDYLKPYRNEILAYTEDGGTATTGRVLFIG